VQQTYNRSFWRDNLDIKHIRGGCLFTTMDMGVLLPPWTVADCFCEEHSEAMQWMAENCAAFPGKTTFYLSLKNEYAHVFLKNMESVLVAKARLAGFRPLFLMKNAIVQKKSNYGLNGHQVTSINIKPRSYLALVGFFKGGEDNLQLITLKNQQNQFMVIDSGATQH